MGSVQYNADGKRAPRGAGMAMHHFEEANSFSKGWSNICAKGIGFVVVTPHREGQKAMKVGRLSRREGDPTANRTQQEQQREEGAVKELQEIEEEERKQGDEAAPKHQANHSKIHRKWWPSRSRPLPLQKDKSSSDLRIFSHQPWTLRCRDEQDKVRISARLLERYAINDEQTFGNLHSAVQYFCHHLAGKEKYWDNLL